MDPDLFRRITASFPESHLLVNPDDGRILAANRSAERELRLREADDRSLLALIASEADGLREYLAACARTGSPIPGTIELRGSEGSTRRFRCEGARFQANGAERAVILRIRQHVAASERFLLLNRKIDELNREIRQRRRAETELREQASHLEELAVELELTIEQLQQQKDDATRARVEAEHASRAKSEFLAVMSHELRTPLNAILGHVDLLDAGVRGALSEPQRAQLERVRSNALQLLDMIQQILVFSHIEAGRATITPDSVELAQLVHDAAELIRPLAQRKGVELEIDTPAPVVIRSDRAKLNQILQNLLSNAVKFTDRGRISLRVEALRTFVLISVRDTGPGIADDDLSRIFEPFTQMDASRTRVTGGVGMGLAVSRQLAQLLGGDIRVESTAGVGSCFTLRLPSNG